MLKMTYLKHVFMVVVLSTASMTAFADDAPVFDADNYPPQFDGQTDAGNSAGAAVTHAQPDLANPPVSAQSSTSAPSPAPAASTDQSYTPPDTANLSPDQRIARVEQQINNMQHSVSSDKLEALHSELQTLRGQVDDLTHQLQVMQTQQKSMYSDFDKRLTKLAIQAPQASNSAPELDTSDVIKPAPKKLAAPKAKSVTAAVDSTAATGSSSTDTASTASSSQPNVAEEQQVYQTAYDLIKSKKYDQAIAALKGMLKKYPSGQFAANAHYWLGELYGLQNKNDQSAVEFSSVVTNFPDSPKVSDAQLKLGLIYAAELKWSEARSSFKKVINHYPGSASARLASEQLKQIKLAGH